jgi:hypothetical protein
MAEFKVTVAPVYTGLLNRAAGTLKNLTSLFADKPHLLFHGAESTDNYNSVSVR